MGLRSSEPDASRGLYWLIVGGEKGVGKGMDVKAEAMEDFQKHISGLSPHFDQRK